VQWRGKTRGLREGGEAVQERNGGNSNSNERLEVRWDEVRFCDMEKRRRAIETLVFVARWRSGSKERKVAGIQLQEKRRE
jgi:hypothetical protein